MSPRNGKPLTWSPLGASDTEDGTNQPKGVMSALTNVVPDPSTANCFTARPASIQLTDFTGFSTPGFISYLFITNGVAYGMIASALHAGKDEPFAYNLLTNAFITISGISGTNTPTSPPTSGAWTPPSMDLIGTKIIVTHPGFSGTSTHFFGIIDISTPSSPAWSDANTAINVLPGVPTFVKNFNQRAYYVVENQAWYSDVLVPDTMTNAAQAVTLGDNSSIVALIGLGLATTNGGVVQALIAFKNATIFQITGDAATMDLAENEIPAGVGTFAPLSVCNTPAGVAFIAPDGLRILSQAASVSEPIGDAGKGVCVPFISTLTPSRICGAFNRDTLRYSVQNNAANGNPVQEWWYHVSRKVWTGPHNFPASQIQGYETTFITAASGINAKLWQSDPVPIASSTYVENSVQMTFAYQTSLFPTIGTMFDNSMKYTTIGVASQAATGAITVSFLDENETILAQAVLGIVSNPSLWGTMVWGTDLWLGAVFALSQIPVPWETNIVFRQGSIRATGNCFTGLKISNISLMYQPLGALSR